MSLGRLVRTLLGVLAFVGVLALFAAMGFVLNGVSARPEPPAFEATLARAVRHRLIPRAARTRENPVQSNDELMVEAMRHWADHCASCHGNDGKGDTAIGRGLYPRAPDMTLPAAQDLSDGELFWIIENGVKLTGMPAWGSASGEESDESWGLVHFIRRLPVISEDELKEMKRFNPTNREEVERQQEIERFLAGGPKPPRPRDDEHHH